MHTVTIFHQTIMTDMVDGDATWFGWDREGLCLGDRATNEFTPIVPLSVVRDIMANQPKDVRIAITGDEDVPYLWDHNGIDILVVWEAADDDVTVFGPVFENENGDLTRRLTWRSPRSTGAGTLSLWEND